MRDSGNIELAI